MLPTLETGSRFLQSLPSRRFGRGSLESSSLGGGGGGVRVSGFWGFRVLGFRVSGFWGLGFGGLGFRVLGLGFRV